MAKPTREMIICIGFLFSLSSSFGYGRIILLGPATDDEMGASLVSNTGSGSGSNAGTSKANGSGGDSGIHSCSGFTFGSGIISGSVGQGQFTGTLTVPGLGTITVPMIGVPLLNNHAIAMSLKGSANTATSDLHDEWTTPPRMTLETLSPSIDVFSQATPKVTESPSPPDEVFGGEPMPEEISSVKPGTVSP